MTESCVEEQNMNESCAGNSTWLNHNGWGAGPEKRGTCLRKCYFALREVFLIIPILPPPGRAKRIWRWNCDFMGEKWSKLQRSCYVKVCYNQSVVFCFCWNLMQPGWRVQVVCLHHEEQARGSETRPASWSTMGPTSGVHWTFGFVQRPRFSATAPNMGQRPQVNGPRSGLSVTTKTATTVDESVKNE